MLPKFCVSTICCGTGRCIFLAAANGKSDSPPASRSRNIFSHPACRTFVTPEAECVSRGEVTKIFENARWGSLPSLRFRASTRESRGIQLSRFGLHSLTENRLSGNHSSGQRLCNLRACCRSFFSSGGPFFLSLGFESREAVSFGFAGPVAIRRQWRTLQPLLGGVPRVYG